MTGARTTAAGESALHRSIPSLRASVPWFSLGHWPTPIDRLSFPGATAAFVKREDLSHPIYGGNKVRTLEGHFGAAHERRSSEIWSIGAYGSNHATATALHADAAGLRSGVALFWQPPSAVTHENMLAFLSAEPITRNIAHVTLVPAVYAALKRRQGAYVMPPGGANPRGSLGHVGAALEVAEQVARGELPAPRTIVLAVGSTCTTAGLLVGFRLAADLGIGFTTAPTIVAVRATPWPVTSRHRILALAYRTAAFLRSQAGEALPLDTESYSDDLVVDGRYLGRGYGRPTAGTRGAMALFSSLGGPALDAVYSGKAGTAFLERWLDHAIGAPYLFWSTKSSAPLPVATAAQRDRAPRRWRRWLADAEIV